MKIKLFPALSIGIAVLVIGSVAYATDRRRGGKASNPVDGKIHEEEALRRELLTTGKEQEKQPQKTVSSDKHVSIASDEKKENVLLAELTRK